MYYDEFIVILHILPSRLPRRGGHMRGKTEEEPDNMKIRNVLISAAVAAVGGIGIVNAEAPLPKVTILGKTFYYYETKKGETLNDIASRYGWDEKILSSVNSDVDSHPDSGTLIYYPVAKGASSGSSTSRSSNTTASAIESDSNATHTSSVEAGNTSTAAQQSPARGQQNSTVEERSRAASSEFAEDGYQYHTVEDGESLYGIARHYNTTIENLFRLNPGLSAGTPKTGWKIRVLAENGAKPKVFKETVEETRVDGMTEYKARRGDSWESVAETNNIPLEALRSANPGIAKLQKGTKIHIPVVTSVQVEKEVVAEDPRAKNEEGIKEIYQEVHSLPQSSNKSEYADEEPSVGVAIVLTDFGHTEDEKRSKKNKEMEFSRGALKAMDDLRKSPFKTRLTIIDGSLPSDSIRYMLDDFRPTMLVSTSDTDIPDYLINYCDSASTMLVNAFSLKDEQYVENPHLLQYMTPSNYMNSGVAEYLVQEYSDYQLLIAGSQDPSDNLANAVVGEFIKKGSDRVTEVTIEELETLELPDPEGKYLIYATPTGQKDVQDLLKKTVELRERHMLADIRVIGRPNWIALVTSTRDNAFKDLLDANYTMIPSRFYFDPEDYATSHFIDDYKTLFHIGPMKASPVYCATAYDIMTYFVPNLANNNGDFNATFTWHPTIQSPISLERVSNWGGVVNKGVYLINYTPSGFTDKKLIPKM